MTAFIIASAFPYRRWRTLVESLLEAGSTVTL
jgi:hypothetical protein